MTVSLAKSPKDVVCLFQFREKYWWSCQSLSKWIDRMEYYIIFALLLPLGNGINQSDTYLMTTQVCVCTFKFVSMV